MTTWTPLPPALGEPACWSWEIPPLRTLDEAIAELMTGPDPLSPGAAALVLRGAGGPEGYRFTEFHAAGRCAICGVRGGDVEDHCHDTGQIRGYLCRSCNTREGLSSHPLFVRYRRIHPAAILDLHEMYTGMGWTDGWSWVEHGNLSRRGGERPATPWPVWSPDDPV